MLPTNEETLAVELKGINKSFNGIRVLKDVDFHLRQGEIHALMGGNGAGKSTLMKILRGVYIADAGEIWVKGEQFQFRTPHDSTNQGIGMVFQEFSLIPTLTVAQNIFLTNEPRSAIGLIDDRKAEVLAKELFREIGVSIDPRAELSNLGTGYWQLTEIAKTWSQNTKVLILDEPTAALTGTETQALFDLIRNLKDKGTSIIYISHRMEEIFQIADRITVLRDGERVATEQADDMTMHELVEHIVGKKMEEGFTWHKREVDRSGIPLMEVHRLEAAPAVEDVSFELYPGEILGVAGLMGSGRTEMVRALFGIDRIQSGQVTVRGKNVSIRSSQDAMKAGLCLIPEDRRAQGLVLGHTMKDNFLLPILRNLKQFGLVNDAQGNQLAKTYVDKLEIKTDSIHKMIRLLSGGNQQKVVIAKWLAANPDILLMDEPTAGVDIGAKTEILEVIRNLANEGKGIVMISSEFTELLAVADRILIMRNGVVTKEVMREEIVSEEILEHMVQTTFAEELTLNDAQIRQLQNMQATAAIVMHYRNNDWSEAQIAGLKSQFDKMGVEVITVTDANFDPVKQVADIESVLAQNPDVIVAVPADTEQTSDVFRRAAAQGIKLIFVNEAPKGLIQDTDYESVVGTDDYGHGVKSAHMMGNALAGQGKIGLIYHDARYFVTEQRHVAFKRTIQDDYGNIEIVSELGISGPDFAAQAEEAATVMLRNHSDLNGIWAVWDVPAQGVLTALDAAKRGDVVVTTVDLGLNVALSMARGGAVKGLVAQRPFDQGITEAVLAGFALLGEDTPLHVVLDGPQVTGENVLKSWQTVYDQPPPDVLTAALRK